MYQVTITTPDGVKGGMILTRTRVAADVITAALNADQDEPVTTSA
jgi:hypothetical protein